MTTTPTAGTEPAPTGSVSTHAAPTTSPGAAEVTLDDGQAQLPKLYAPPGCGDAAAYYAQLGWQIVTLPGEQSGHTHAHEGDDHHHVALPRATGEGATTDIATIRSRWVQRPSSNVGIALGDESGIVALEVAPVEGGDKSLDRIQREHGLMPATLTACRSDGGRLLFFVAAGPRVQGAVIPAQRCVVNGKMLSIRDILECDLVRPRTIVQFQCENQTIRNWDWQVKRRLKAAAIEQFVEDTSPVLHSPSDRVATSVLEAKAPEEWQSLQLVKPTHLQFGRHYYDPRRHSSHSA